MSKVAFTAPVCWVPGLLATLLAAAALFTRRAAIGCCERMTDARVRPRTRRTARPRRANHCGAFPRRLVEGRAGPRRHAAPVADLGRRPMTRRQRATSWARGTNVNVPSCVFCGRPMAAPNTVAGVPIHLDCFTRMCVAALVKDMPVVALGTLPRLELPMSRWTCPEHGTAFTTRTCASRTATSPSDSPRTRGAGSPSGTSTSRAGSRSWPQPRTRDPANRRISRSPCVSRARTRESTDRCRAARTT